MKLEEAIEIQILVIKSFYIIVFNELLFQI